MVMVMVMVMVSVDWHTHCMIHDWGNLKTAADIADMTESSCRFYPDQDDDDDDDDNVYIDYNR